MIFNFYQYITEGLIKTHDFDVVKSKEHIFLNPLRINYDLIYYETNNTIHLEIDYFNKIQDINSTIDCIESFMVNMMGWFPSHMILINLHDKENSLPYNRFFLKDKQDFLEKVVIIFESKFDIQLTEVPKKLYHLTIQEFENKIQKQGLIPKSKSKLSFHPDRIYFTKHKLGCLSLINQMKFFYKSNNWLKIKSKINDKWLIYEIDTTNLDLKIYCDPNYIGGFYVLNNIPPTSLKIIDRE